MITSNQSFRLVSATASSFPSNYSVIWDKHRKEPMGLLSVEARERVAFLQKALSLCCEVLRTGALRAAQACPFSRPKWRELLRTLKSQIKPKNDNSLYSKAIVYLLQNSSIIIYIKSQYKSSQPGFILLISLFFLALLHLLTWASRPRASVISS